MFTWNFQWQKLVLIILISGDYICINDYNLSIFRININVDRVWLLPITYVSISMIHTLFFKKTIWHTSTFTILVIAWIEMKNNNSTVNNWWKVVNKSEMSYISCLHDLSNLWQTPVRIISLILSLPVLKETRVPKTPNSTSWW